MSEPLEIFRTGRHTATSGAVIDFTAAHLAAIASGYDPALHEAPAVVGHPSADAPAYGWIKALKLAGDKLVAELGQVDPAFAEMVKAGRFKKLSPSFYPPDGEGNPKPGQFYLRHLGFLGAQAPAVKGLKPAHFAGANERFITFGEIPSSAVVRLFRRIRDHLVSSAGIETAEQILPADELDSLGHLAAQPDNPDREDDAMPDPTYAEREAALAKREKEVKEGEAALKAQTTQFSEREKALLKTENEAFVDALVKAGKFLPALKPGALAFMERIGTIAEPLEFAEGSVAVKAVPLGYFKEFLSKASVAVTFGEAARVEDVDARAGIHFEFAPGTKVDRARLELHEKALAYQEAHKGVDFVTACKAVGVA